MPQRTYVTVTALFDEGGRLTPLTLRLRGRSFDVERVLDCRNAAATKSGGQGLRYTVRVLGRETYLFLDEHQRWFVEEKDSVR